MSAVPSGGLTTAESARRLREYGPNATPQERPHPLLALLSKFWAPVPWMLEVTVVLELVMGRHMEAGVIGLLLVFNAVLSFVQENRAQNALALLRQRLEIQARVLRDGQWRLLPARELVPGDVIHLRMGDMTPADVQIASGQILLDQSALTGESVPVEAGTDHPAYAGTIVRRGEATGTVTATGTRTAFGKTAELVRLAKTTSHLERIIFGIVRYLVALDAVLVAAVLVYAVAAGISLNDILPFALILLVASIPVALPATFTLATALGALELIRQGVLVTRLAAIEEAAAMDVLCSDKTGTITKNQLAVAGLHAYPPNTQDDTLRLAALASDQATQDPIDLAILSAARDRSVLSDAWRQERFIPFEPATKRSEAFVQHDEQRLHVMKGSPQVIADLLGQNAPAGLDHDVTDLAATGARVLAVAGGADDHLAAIGLLALQDPPREDSKELVQDLHDLGIRVTMVTGDGPVTAAAVARQVGLGHRVSPAGLLRKGPQPDILGYDVFAGVLPADKFHLVQALQRAGHTTGMTGDGVNDAPALKQAEVGIAVASATDVAKAAASLVLTRPGLVNVVAAVETSRQIYQRMLTYTLNKIIKTIEIAIFLSLGLILTGTFVTTPTLIVLLLFTNDFVTMSIATDRVAYARTPRRWHIGPLVMTALSLAALILILSFAIFWFGKYQLHLPLAQFQTLIFVMLVFSGQCTVYLVRERRHFWNSMPGRWLLVASVADIAVVSLLATQGILMAPVAPVLVAGTLLAIALYLVPVDFAKIRLVRYFNLD